jgi:hypothetical protein
VRSIELTLLLLLLNALTSSALAEPTCEMPDAKNYVLAWSTSNLADGWDAQWLLQNVDSGDRIFLRRCSADEKNKGCYFATDVAPGKYYFQEVVPSSMNSLVYPVSKKALWFEITGKGVDYIGDWVIERTRRRVIDKLEVNYKLKTLDHMIESCKIKGRTLFLSKAMTGALEIID